MEDRSSTIYEEKRGWFQWVAGVFSRPESVEFEEAEGIPTARTIPPTPLKSGYQQTVTVRRHLMNFEDAMAAANGLRSGEQQLLNLCATEPTTRQKIVDFMCGVNYAQDGTWEEVGENIYLIVPSHTYVEVIPPNAKTGAGGAQRN
jgi:cell division inhibitor SepF